MQPTKLMPWFALHYLNLLSNWSVVAVNERKKNTQHKNHKRHPNMHLKIKNVSMFFEVTYQFTAGSWAIKIFVDAELHANAKLHSPKHDLILNGIESYWNCVALSKIRTFQYLIPVRVCTCVWLTNMPIFIHLLSNGNILMKSQKEGENLVNDEATTKKQKPQQEIYMSLWTNGTATVFEWSPYETSEYHQPCETNNI